MSQDPQTRREFCVQACQGAALAALGVVLQGCGGSGSSPTGASPGSALPVINGTLSAGVITLRIDASSPLAAVGSAALVETTSGSLLVAHTGQDTFVALSARCTHQACADSILKDDGRKAFTATGRYQWDFGPRMTLVASGLYRDQSKVDPRSGGGGLAFGVAPTSRLSIWNEADAKFESGTSGPPAYILMNETGFEVYRGVWLSVSPQLRTEVGSASSGVWRLAFAANLLPRTHWNVEMSYYHDRSRLNDLVTKTFLAQLHLYL